MGLRGADREKNMKRNGNAIANKLYNPRNVKPPIPIDVDEVDSAMGRFIRQKYDLKVLEDGRPKPPSRHDPSYTNRSPEDSPPPLPPKTGRRFGFGLRSASSTYPTGSEKASTCEDAFGTLPHPININRQPGGLEPGPGDVSGSFGSKLAMLREMGFPDDERNATVLKGLGGNLERTIESLVRLGEGTSAISRCRTPLPEPVASAKPHDISTNPFDKMDSVPTHGTVSAAVNVTESQAISTGVQAATAKSAPYNPFDVPTSQLLSPQPLDQSFQRLQISQPLFPNITGGYPSQQGQVPYPRHLQSMTPPVTMSSQHNFVTSPASLNDNYN